MGEKPQGGGDPPAAARLEARVVLEELLARCPAFRVDVAGGRYARGSYVRRHERLVMRTA